MDATAHYKNLVTLGREEFLASSAPAALIRFRAGYPAIDGATTLTLDADAADNGADNETIEETMPLGKDFFLGESELEVYPLAKKPGASFPDRITIGRTPNNDIVITDASISRLHAYVKLDASGAWVVADGGSKNGSWLDNATLDARKERPIRSRQVLRLGDVDLTFFLAAELFAALGGT